MTVQDYLNNGLYTVTVILAALIFSRFSKRRGHFALRLTLSVAVILAAASLIIFLIGFVPLNYIVWAHMMRFFIVFVLSGVMTYVCFSCSPWEALFFAVAGYSLQHIQGRVFSIAQSFLLPDLYWAWNTVISFILTLAVYSAFYFFYIKPQLKNMRPQIYNKAQLMVAALVVGVSIFYNSFGISYASQVIISLKSAGFDPANGYKLLLFVYVTSTLIAYLALFVSFGSNYMKSYEMEKSFLNQLIKRQEKQYEADKQNIELLNLRLHDLKHYVGSIDDEQLVRRKDDVLRQIESYDMSVKCGNETLDVLLTQKSIVCAKDGIRLNCLLNGKDFDFIPKYELYCLFVNAIDNAVEALKKLPEEKRLLSITGRRREGALVLLFENYFDDALEFTDGLPKTGKGFLHGYGMKSIKMISEKYGGEVSVAVYGDSFSLEIRFKDS